MSNPNYPTDRRKVLKSIASSTAAVGGLAVGSGVVAASDCGIPDLSFNYSEDDYEWKDADSVNETNIPSGMATEYGIETQTSVYGTSFYEAGKWHHEILEGAHVVAKNKSEYDTNFQLAENIYSHKVTINNIWPDKTDLFTTQEQDSTWVGGAPDPNGSTDYGAYGDAAYTALKFALAMESAKFAVATTAINIAGALINSGQTDSGSTQEYQWNYSPPNVCEGAHKALFLIIGHGDYEKASVEVYEYSVADMGNVNNSYTWDLYIDPFHGGIQSISSDQTTAISDSTDQSISKESDPEWQKMSENERKEYLESREDFVKISNGYLQAESDEPAYVAKNPQVIIKKKETAPDKYYPKK